MYIHTIHCGNHTWLTDDINDSDLKAAIAQHSDDPETMSDYYDRADRGEFKGKTIEQIRAIYRNEELDKVEDAAKDEHFDRIKSE